MRITCHDIFDFEKNLESADSVHRQTVFYNRSQRHLEGYSYEITYQLSAVLEFDDETQALLEAGVVCGIDQETADGDMTGTDKMKELHVAIAGYCRAKELKMLPGILDM